MVNGRQKSEHENIVGDSFNKIRGGIPKIQHAVAPKRIQGQCEAVQESAGGEPVYRHRAFWKPINKIE